MQRVVVVPDANSLRFAVSRSQKPILLSLNGIYMDIQQWWETLITNLLTLSSKSTCQACALQIVPTGVEAQ
jgi:hypothetical protein